MKRVLASVAFAAVLAASSACSKQAGGQSVAVVNGEEVSVPELNAELALAGLSGAADQQAAVSETLERVIHRKLLAQAAINRGVDRTPEYLIRQRRMNEELLVGLFSERLSGSVNAPTAAEINRFIAANPSMFQNRSTLFLEQIQLETASTASVLQDLKDDRSLQSVAATLVKRGIPFERRSNRLSSAVVPPPLLRQIDQLQPGEPFIVPAGGRVVVSVVARREPAAVSMEQSRRDAAEILRKQKLADAISNQVEALRGSAKIDYKEGYAPVPKAKSGRWGKTS